MDRQAFGARLRALRHAAGLTQADIAERTGASPRSIADWEPGHHSPAPWYWHSLAEAFAVPVDALFAPDGWAVLPSPWLRPETLALMQGSEAGFEQVYELVCKRMREAMLLARPLTPVPPGRRRRSREDVLLKGHKPSAKRGRGGG